MRAYVIRSEWIREEQERVSGDMDRFEIARVLRIEEFPSPELKSDEVRARVLAFSAEHNVIHAALADTVDIVALRGGELRPGNSFVGEVVEVGEAVSTTAVGDLVAVAATSSEDANGFPIRAWAYDEPGSVGAYAEEVVIPERMVGALRLDCGLSLWELASLPVRGPSAYHLWRRGSDIFRAKVGREKMGVLNVLAFGGGVSELFLMLAAAEGHRAFYCASSERRRKYMESLGVQTIDQREFNRFASFADIGAFRKRVKAETDGVGMHIVCDMFRGPVFAASLVGSARGGVIVSSGWQLSADVNYNSALLSVRQITLDHAHIESTAGVRAASSYYGRVMRPPVHDEIYGFEDLPRALEELRRSTQSGIPVVAVAKELPARAMDVS